MSDSAWRGLAVLCAGLAPAIGLAQVDSAKTQAPPAPHEAVAFLHDRFHLSLAAEFAAGSLAIGGNLPGTLGLSPQGMAARLGGVGYRQNSVPFQVGEFHWQSGSGEELGVLADRTSWEAEPLGYPPSGADDAAMLPCPADSAYLFPVPLFGYQSAQLLLWRDPVLPDSAHATARYTNGPAGYSYTGGRLRSELGAGFEMDAQVYRIFSDGLESTSGFDGHNLDLELRRAWGRVPMRLRFRQNSAQRDLLFRWQADPTRATHDYYLTYVTLEAAVQRPASEWLIAYDLRVEDQEKRAVSSLSSYQYWFERRHRLGLSRLSEGRLSYWGAAAAEYRESDVSTGLPDAWLADFNGGAKWSGSVLSLLLSAGARLPEGREPEYRAATALRFELSPGHALLMYLGVAREQPSTLRQYLPADSGSVYGESGDPNLPDARHTGAALVWRRDRPRLSWDMLAAVGSSQDLPVWSPQGDTATLASRYAPVPTDRSGTTLGARATARPWSCFELEGSWRHVWETGSTPPAAYSPEDGWLGAVRLPFTFEHVNLRLTPEGQATGGFGGTLPGPWWTLSLGVTASIKQLSVFWFRDNALDETFRTGGAYPWYGTHSRFGFSWNFWN
jgi:hypothetical protein